MTVKPERAIAHHIAACRYEQIPQAAIAVAKRSIIDGMAALMAGRRSEGIDPMLTLVERWGGPPEARIYATGRRAPAPLAAWVNGAQIRALELDDCTDTLPLHPTAAVLPALLAAADILPLTGKDLIRAIAIAQDLKIRFGLAITRHAMQTGRNNIFRIFAVTAGVASAMKLNEAQTLHALGMSASYGAGDSQCILEGSTATRVQFGNSGRGALESCLLAQAGLSGPEHFLVGPYGYLNAFEPEHDLNVLLSDLGARFEGTRISVKPYAACRCTHSAIDLAMSLRSRHPAVRPEGIERIEIVVSPEVYRLVGGPRETKLRPQNSSAAQFSLNFMTAAVLLGGEAGLAETQPDRLCDPGILALADRIHITSNTDNRTDQVVGRTDLRVTMVAGEHFLLSSEHPLGAPRNPIASDRLRAKLQDCIAYSKHPIGSDALDRLVRRVERLETEPLASAVLDDLA